ncbi:MAG: S41 family peptidase, partial [Janthinobacterium sp.]
MRRFQAAGISDLVLDVRYNGGGYLDVASELAYMIAGPQITAGKTFEQVLANDKTRPEAPVPFHAQSQGFAGPNPLPKGTLLPSLGLKRVTLLTTGNTCSASEAIINGLRGVDVQVNLIGGTTCGKPYGFYPTPNCGTTYFAVQFQGVNAKGYGDFADGMAPTCDVTDDYQHQLGDPAEGM